MNETFHDLARVTLRPDTLVAELLRPHRVLSTSPVAGGMREDVCWLVNHKMCEPGDPVDVAELPGGSVEGLARQVCVELGLDADSAATMLTAASMENAAAERREFDHLSVMAVATAGVSGNADRAGDPAKWIEVDGRWQQVGTINVMLFLNQPLTEGALVKAGIVVTEAKSAALQDLAVVSLSSSGIATGTGTDQIAIAAPLEGEHAQTECGSHTKLGELIAQATAAAIKRSLSMQDSRTPFFPGRAGAVADGRLVAITGDGRGKTTSSMGLAMRAVGQGYRVLVMQFIKGTWRTGEQEAARLFGGRLTFRRAGLGFIKDDTPIEEHRRAAQAGFDQAVAAARAGECDVLVLDEIHNALRKQLLDPDAVFEFLKQRPRNLHIVLTGRGAPQQIIDLADTVSEVQLIKHAMADGVEATRGIEF